MRNPRLPSESVDKRVYNQGESFLIVERSPIEICGRLDPELVKTLVYLNFLSVGLKRPRPEDVDRSVFEKIGDGCMYHIVNVTSHDPLGFKFDEYDPCSTIDGGRNYTGLVVGDYPNSVIADFLARSYSRPRDSESIRFDAITRLPAGEAPELRRYYRYVYPLASDGYRIDKILVATNFLPYSPHLADN